MKADDRWGVLCPHYWKVSGRNKRLCEFFVKRSLDLHLSIEIKPFKTERAFLPPK